MNRSVLNFALAVGVAIFSTPMAANANHLGGAGGDAGHAAVGQRLSEDVRNTLHNLGDSISGVLGAFDNPNIVANAGSNREVCVFCHTPHGGTVVGGGAAPLWNRAVNTAGYTPYAGPNMDNLPGQPVGVSLACLSCHDGTIAVDSLINLPGSGGFRGLTPTTFDLVDPQGATTLLTADADGAQAGRMAPGLRGTAGEKNYEAITGGVGAEPFPNLTQNLADDHPISMVVPTGTDPQFSALLFTQSGQVGLISTASKVSPADKRDALRTYPATGTGAWASPGWVECASCHNPHAPRPVFLRLPIHTAAIESGGGTTTVGAVLGVADTQVIADNPNAGSAICLSCHQK